MYRDELNQAPVKNGDTWEGEKGSTFTGVFLGEAALGSKNEAQMLWLDGESSPLLCFFLRRIEGGVLNLGEERPETLSCPGSEQLLLRSGMEMAVSKWYSVPSGVPSCGLGNDSDGCCCFPGEAMSARLKLATLLQATGS